MSVLSDTQLFIERDLDITWHTVKAIYTTSNIKVDLADMKVCINVEIS